jgi:hypothetical protein
MLPADNSHYPSASTIFFTGSLVLKAVPDSLHPNVQKIDITQRCCTTSHRTLGALENPAGISKTEYTHLVTKGQKMAQLFQLNRSLVLRHG